jgi:eukaryotic-like serine/threonine-protein kinase
MKADRLRQVDEIFQTALDLAPGERSTYLKKACEGDAELRREVESLIAAYERGGSFIERPAIEVDASVIAGPPAGSFAGKSIQHYRIVKLLGAGGMGEVYLATDTRLGRHLALKLLPDFFTTDQARVRRFRQEARSASALNHPNILTIYEIGEAGGQFFIAMEYVDGVSLRELIHSNHASLHKLLKYLTQVAEGLSKAHAAGIVHRDLKPDNIMISRDGYAKVLDFGLAKLVQAPKPPPAEEGSGEAATALMAHPQSLPGMVMGTPGYMSPEQAQGKQVDLRSDIFSFGCILFEAATGQKPFEGDSVIASLHKTVYEPAPPLRELNPALPLELQRIVRRCLMKDAEERYQTIKDVAIELRELRREMESAEAELHRSAAPALPGGASISGTGDVSAPTSAISGAPRMVTDEVSAPRSTSSAEYLVNEIKRHKWPFFIVLSVIVAALAGLGFGLYKFFDRNQSARSGAPLKVTPLTSSPGVERSASFSPDGKQVAFIWTGEKNDNFDVYVKIIGAGEPLRLTTNPGKDMSPAWSPDGRYIAFERGSGEDKGFYLIPALGGAERKLADAYGQVGPGTTPEALDWSPDGKTLAVVDTSSEDEPFSIFLISVETGERRRLTQPPAGLVGDQFVSFSPDGSRLAFVRRHAQQEGDICTVAVTGGEPTRITSDGAGVYGLAWTRDGASLVFSSDRGGGDITLWRVPATGGTPALVAGVGSNVHELSIARQGDRLAYAQSSGDVNIYRLELTGQAGGRRIARAPVSFIASTRQELAPQISPDGRKVAFISDRSGSAELWVSDAEGKSLVQLTSFGGPRADTPSWSPDGRLIAFTSLAGGNAHLYVVGAEGGSPRRLTTDAAGEASPGWSKDGRWIYFTSKRTGRNEVFKIAAAGGAAVELTQGGGQSPVESPDGRRVYYVKGRVGSDLWQVGAEGGEETRVVEAKIDERNWAVEAHGIYFLTLHREVSAYALEFYDFATRQTTQITTIEGPRSTFLISGLTVSPDERWILYAQRDKIDFDLMLIENFR